jgi:hypothetical protein
MGRAGKKVVREGSDEDDVPLAQRKRKVGASTQAPRGRGRTNPPAAPRQSKGQGHRARTKQAHQPNDHYDDYEDISLDTLSSFILRPSIPPRPATQMGIVKMVDYTRGSHNVYKERYSDPALWKKEFDSDIRFWLKFNADWYESVILSKDHLTVDMKSINWELLRSLNIPVVNDAIDICHAKGMTNVMAINYDWNEDLGRPKLHGGEFPLDSEMAFMYDSMYGKVEFGTTHGMKPVYRMLNQLFRYTLTPKIGDNTNISIVAKEILVRMAPGKEDFSIFDFIWEEIIVCSVSSNKSCQYAPWIFKMICEVTGVDILPDKSHSWYKPNKGNIERLLKLGKHAPPRPAPVGGTSSSGPSSYEPPSSSRGPFASRGTVPPRQEEEYFQLSISRHLCLFQCGKAQCTRDSCAPAAR